MFICEDYLASIHELKLNRNWIMQQDNSAEHTSRSTKEQSRDLNPTEILQKEVISAKVGHTSCWRRGSCTFAMHNKD